MTARQHSPYAGSFDNITALWMHSSMILMSGTFSSATSWRSSSCSCVSNDSSFDGFQRARCGMTTAFVRRRSGVVELLFWR